MHSISAQHFLAKLFACKKVCKVFFLKEKFVIVSSLWFLDQTFSKGLFFSQGFLSKIKKVVAKPFFSAELSVSIFDQTSLKFERKVCVQKVGAQNNRD